MHFFKFVFIVIITITTSALSNTSITIEGEGFCGLNLSSHQEVLDYMLFQAIQEENYRETRKALQSRANPNTLATIAFVNRDVLESSKESTDNKPAPGKDIKMTPLHAAVIVGNPHIVRLLLEFDAKTTIENSVGLTAFASLAYQEQIDETNRRLIVLAFMEPQPSGPELTTAFHHAVISGNIPVVETIFTETSQPEILEDLIRRHRFTLNNLFNCISLPIQEVRRKICYNLISRILRKQRRR